MASSLSDAELMFELKKGRVDAFDELVDRHERRLVSFFYHRSWDRHLSEDCAQEVFVRLYTHAGTYVPQAKFTTYLFRIAHNYWIDRLRAGRHRHAQSLDAGADGPGGALGDHLASPEPTPVEASTHRETTDRVRRAIDRLPADQRMVVLLSETQGLRYDEISEILGVPVGTIKSRMHAAVQRLKELLAKTWNEA